MDKISGTVKRIRDILNIAEIDGHIEKYTIAVIEEQLKELEQELSKPKDLNCKHGTVISVRHALKCDKCGELFESVGQDTEVKSNT